MQRLFWKVVVACAALAVATTGVQAQTEDQCPTTTTTVRRAACPAGTTFESGSCHSGPNWLGHRSHCLVTNCGTCRATERLNPATGECLRDVTRTEGTSACPPDHTFAGGTCQSPPNWLGHRSHCRLQDCGVCGDDQILDLDDGLCCDAPD